MDSIPRQFRASRGFSLIYLAVMTVLLAALFLCAGFSGARAAQHVTVLVSRTGGRVDWGANDRIAFDKQGADGWFQVWTMTPDGKEQRCVTCGAGFPKMHNGNPAWHPSGKFIVFQSLDDKIKTPWLFGKLYRVFTNPGAGVNNNIWIATADGSKAWQMTDLGKGKGVLHPHFSHDGKTLVWAEMTDTSPLPTGTWQIMRADFSVANGAPRLSHVAALRPGNLQFYETHSFTPDDGALLFTGKPFKAPANSYDIYKYTFADGSLQLLTDPAAQDWDEHAQMSPDGTRILWMSSKGLGVKPGTVDAKKYKAEFWLMDADGNNKRQITHFNDPKSADYIPGHTVAADSSWSPDGKRFVAYIEANATAEEPGDIVVVDVAE